MRDFLQIMINGTIMTVSTLAGFLGIVYTIGSILRMI